MTGPLAAFAHASDLHLGPVADPAFALAGERAACLWADLRRGPALNWLVVSGDLTHHGSARPADLEAARRAMEGPGMPPWSVLPGNHDLSPSPVQAARSGGTERYEDVPLEQTGYGLVFGPEGVFFRRVLAGVEFVGFALRAGDPDGQLPRLRALLAEPGALRARVVVGHYPTRPVRAAGPLRACGPAHLGPTAEDLGALLDQERPGAPPVLAYLFGHVHALAARRHGGIWHATPGAVGAGCPGHRLGLIWPDRIETRFVPLSDPHLAAIGFWSPQRPVECTDPEHPDRASYHGGTRQERCLTIPLPPA